MKDVNIFNTGGSTKQNGRESGTKTKENDRLYLLEYLYLTLKCRALSLSEVFILRIFQLLKK